MALPVTTLPAMGQEDLKASQVSQDRVLIPQRTGGRTQYCHDSGWSTQPNYTSRAYARYQPSFCSVQWTDWSGADGCYLASLRDCLKGPWALRLQATVVMEWLIGML